MSFFFRALPSNQNRGGSAYNDPAPPPATSVPSWALSGSTSRKKRPQTKRSPVLRKARQAPGKKVLAKRKPARRSKVKEPSPSPSSSSSSSSSSSPTPEPRSLSTSKSPAPKRRASGKRTESSFSFSPEFDSDPEEEEEKEEEEQQLDPDLLSLEAALAESTQIHSLLAASDLLHQELHPTLHTALQQWETYLATLTPLPAYSALTSTEITPRAKKAALLHLVDTLPARHREMVAAYKDKKVEVVILGETVEMLREGLKMMEEGGGGEKEMKLGGYYNHMLFKGVRFREEALMAEKEIRALEEARLGELKGFMGMYEELSVLEGEGRLGPDEVQLLVDAMDHAGLSAGSEAREGGEEICLD
ncbi:Hypothetical predicted protein [Lecanosticta acicola]|uniref:Uncharacterized protein n=1 Tax=Lecanosticta acicola TaxID=111012 RepID=A0AAI8YRX8_9PEZI|nr:Hypothetical predicted protein [Lecanosticta acicola]